MHGFIAFVFGVVAGASCVYYVERPQIAEAHARSAVSVAGSALSTAGNYAQQAAQNGKK